MRVYSHDFRVQVVRRILNGETVSALSKELDIHPKVLYEWKRRVNEGGESNLRKRGRPRNNEVRDGTGSIPRHAAELERTIASQRLVHIMASGWPLPEPTVRFWNSLVTPSPSR